ncbi:MAG: DUF4276 family protein [Nitrospinae bacterium]|nr:DUF4276 family protein [Nitrospinota bacterium]
MKIALIVEGKTEKAFMPHLRKYLERHLAGCMPSLDPLPYGGRIPTGDQLKRIVSNLLENGRNPADHVIALTDVYTGPQSPDFKDAQDAKTKMRQWVGNEPRFHPYAAQHEFEAWLLPYWSCIQKLAGRNKAAPSSTPETVNHHNPPSRRIKEIFRIGQHRNHYIKPRDADRILRDNDLGVAVSQCPELKALINTILSVCGSKTIP